MGQSELGATASRNAVWWDFRLASLLSADALVNFVIAALKPSAPLYPLQDFRALYKILYYYYILLLLLLNFCRVVSIFLFFLA